MLLARSSLFFFSSRRRHTRFDCDWSSDVCSSDLYRAAAAARDRAGLASRGPAHGVGPVRRGGLARGLRGAPGEALAPDRGQPPGLAGKGEGPMEGFPVPVLNTALGPWGAVTHLPPIP